MSEFEDIGPGGPSYRVGCVARGRDGYIWMLTPDGWARIERDLHALPTKLNLWR